MEDTATNGPFQIAALVLAGGLSRRSGAVNKLLADVGGRPMVSAVAAMAVAAGVSRVIVVSGHDAAAVEAAVANTSAECIHNPEFHEGMASSIRHGIAALDDGIDGVLICLGDMPWVAASTLVALAEAYDPDAAHEICRPMHDGKPGNPVLFGRRHFPALSALQGDQGGKGLLRQNADVVFNVAVNDAGIFRDLDVVAS
ncbi:MAG: nucleotidyltransferase family protein [Rhodospirillaceae bacterium]|nr:nucleotidyltransferase family protein [Rhodospirillaceae bacterium]